jgi:hypothetical protein
MAQWQGERKVQTQGVIESVHTFSVADARNQDRARATEVYRWSSRLVLASMIAARFESVQYVLFRGDHRHADAFSVAANCQIRRFVSDSDHGGQIVAVDVEAITDPVKLCEVTFLEKVVAARAN